MKIRATGRTGSVLLPLLLDHGQDRAGTASGLFVGIAQLLDRNIAA